MDEKFSEIVCDIYSNKIKSKMQTVQLSEIFMGLMINLIQEKQKLFHL